MILYHASDMTDGRYLQGLARRVRDGGRLATLTAIGAVVLTLWLAFSTDPALVVTSPTVEPTAAELTPTPTIEIALDASYQRP